MPGFFDDKQMEIVLEKMELLIVQKTDEYFRDRLEAEIRMTVRTELNRVISQMKELVK